MPRRLSPDDSIGDSPQPNRLHDLVRGRGDHRNIGGALIHDIGISVAVSDNLEAFEHGDDLLASARSLEIARFLALSVADSATKYGGAFYGEPNVGLSEAASAACVRAAG
jgi:hypothetical protein